MQKIFVLLSLLIVPVFGFAQQGVEASASGATEVNCGLKTYHYGLTLAFRTAAAGADGETLVTLQVLPSFKREYAIIVKRTPVGVSFLRTTFRKQLWTQLGPPLAVTRTPEQCLDIAKAAEIDTSPLSVSTEQANSLWARFSSINLQTDTCARRKGRCAHIFDGTEYVIQQPDGVPIRLSEVAGMKGIARENPALLDWVHSILRVAARWQEPPLAP